jgi:chromosomal replication initiation ATPase DnaA
MNAPLTEIKQFDRPDRCLREMRPLEIMGLVERKLRTVLVGDTRHRYEVDARKVFVFLCLRARRPISINRLASILDKDHCTLLYYQKVFPANFENDPDVRDMVLEVVGPAEYLLIEKELMNSKAPSYQK